MVARSLHCVDGCHSRSASWPLLSDNPGLPFTYVTWLALGGLLSLITGADMVLRTRPTRRFEH